MTLKKERLMKKFFVSLVFSSLTFGATSQSTTNVSSYWTQLQESPLSFTYLNTIEAASKGADGFTSDHYLYFGYKLDRDHKIMVIPVFRTDARAAQKAQGDTHTEIQYTQLRFYKNNILTEQENGVQLNFQLRNYLYSDNTRDGSGIDSKHRLYFLPSKNFGKVSLTGGVFTQFYNKSNNISGKVRDDYVAVFPYYNFNDNFYAGFGVEYFHGINDIGEKDKEYVTLTLPEVGYSQGRFSVAAYAYYDIAESKDEYSGIKNKWWEEGTIAVDVSYNFF